MKRALILGVSGQDGSYMTEHLLGLGYRVTGFGRHMSRWLKDSAEWIEFVCGDIRDSTAIETAVRKSWPDEIYNFVAQPFIPESWTMPAETLDVNAGGLARLMQVVERVKPDARVYQASTSEMFGNHDGACNEDTPLIPVSPYGVAKLAAHNLARVYSDRGIYVVSGICGNHESPRRGLEMVTRKIARAVAEWSFGGTDFLPVGNLDSKRDWGFAGDYVKAIRLMLQQDNPKTYVIGTGESHSVREFIAEAMSCIEDESPMKDRVFVDPSLVRKNEIRSLLMDARLATSELGWRPETTFKGLVHTMVNAEMAIIERTQRRNSEVMA